MTKLYGKNGRLRFAVGETKSGRLFSDSWTVSQNKSDIYLSSSGVSGILKISLHESGICRYAFTSQFKSHDPPGFPDDRAIIRWTIPKEPIFPHEQIFSLFFASYQDWWEPTGEAKKATYMLPLAIPEYATEVACFISDTNPLDWDWSRFPTKNIIGVFKIEDGRFFTFRRRVIDFPRNRLIEINDTHAKSHKGLLLTGLEGPDKAPPYELGSVFLSEAYKNFANFYSFHGIPLEGPRFAAKWTTDQGHRYKE